jgi:hypothetical protein
VALDRTVKYGGERTPVATMGVPRPVQSRRLPGTVVTVEGTGGGSAPDDEELRRLLDPHVEVPPELREPSAEERLRTAERSARVADLARRLADDERQRVALERRQRRTTNRRSRGRTVRRSAVLAAFVGAVAGLALFMSGMLQLPATEQEAAALRPAGTPPEPPVALEERILAPVAATPAGGAYEFTLTQPGGSTDPVAFDPCRPVRYVVNSAGQPAGLDELLREAIDRTSAATGLAFEFVGTTTEQFSNQREWYQPARYGEQWAPVLITWATQQQVPGLAGYIAGLGGGTPFQLRLGDPMVYVTGELVLDAQDLVPDPADPSSTDRIRATIQHELAHVVGLGHVASPAEMMYPESLPDGPVDWGPGDREGLARLGNGACVPDV